jgi:hypothetical protein
MIRQNEHLKACHSNGTADGGDDRGRCVHVFRRRMPRRTRQRPGCPRGYQNPSARAMLALMTPSNKLATLQGVSTRFLDRTLDHVDEVMRIHVKKRPYWDTRGKCRTRSRLISSTSTSLNTTMASMSEEEERIETVSKFLLQSPPGEINDVLNGTVVSLFHVSWPDAPAPA